MSAMTTPSPHPDPNRNRLPTLFEVLSRQTLAPVDLFSFYIFMRDQQRSVDYLDFWYVCLSPFTIRAEDYGSVVQALTFYIRLDVSQHMSLCRHYVRELRRSVLVETPDLEKQGSKRSSYILDHLGEMNDPSGPSSNLNKDERAKDQNLSAFLRQESDLNGNGGYANSGTRHSPQSSLGSQHTGQRGSGDRPSYGTERERPPRPSFMANGSPGRTNSNSPAHTVARPDIRASAEKILYTYLLPGSEREIILPQGILTEITTSIEEEGRDDPEVFDAAKDYTFQAMERDAFPGFLRAKALGNLVPPSSFLRLCLGLLGLFGAFWAGFACILLDRPKHVRCWVRVSKVL